MFLKCLPDSDCEERYWPFVWRMETVLYGIVTEAAETLSVMSADERIVFLFDSLGASMDRRDKAIPPGWWPEPAPSLEWFDGYLHGALDSLGAEAVRLAALPKEERHEEADDAFDKKGAPMRAPKRSVSAIHVPAYRGTPSGRRPITFTFLPPTGQTSAR